MNLLVINMDVSKIREIISTSNAQYSNIYNIDSILSSDNNEIISYDVKNNNLKLIVYDKSTNIFRLYFKVENLEYILNSINEKIINQNNIVCEVVSREDNDVINHYLRNTDFIDYSVLKRMSQSGSTINIVPTNFSRIATATDFEYLNEKFKFYFDPIVERVPSKSILMGHIENGNVLVYDEKSCKKGFLISELTGKVLHLRYWFVNPECRNMGIGSDLYKGFLIRGKDAIRKILWVISTNKDAIDKYLHLGYQFDGLKSNINLLRKK